MTMATLFQLRPTVNALTPSLCIIPDIQACLQAAVVIAQTRPLGQQLQSQELL